MYINEFSNYLRAKKSSENTIRAYGKDINQMLEVINKPVENITYTDLLNWQGSISNLSSASVARKITAIKQYFKFLCKTNVIPTNPSLDIESVKIHNKETYYIPYEEAVKIIDYGKNPRDKALFAMYITTGLRCSEILNLDLEQYNNDRIVVLTKGNKERIVYLSDACRKYVDDYIAYRATLKNNGCNKLFVSNQGNHMSANCVNDTLRCMAKRAGIEDYKKLHAHSLRHGFITEVADRYGVQVARDVVGHSSLAITNRYVHVKEDVIKNVMLSM